MNAKKIMGAVLVALLAAALFVGAASAAEEQAAGTVFLYQKAGTYSNIANGVYSFGEASVDVSATGVLPLNIEKFVDGAKYSNGTHYIVVKLPNAGFTAIGDVSGAEYDAMANGLIAKQPVQFTATPTVSTFTGSAVEAIIIYNEAGEPTRYDSTDGLSNGVLILSGGLNKGTYQIQAVLAKANNFVNTVEGAQLYGQKYSFTVYSTEPEITASADTVLIGNFITVTISGKPGESYYLDAEGFTIPEKNQVIDTGYGTALDIQSGDSEAIINLPNSGKITVYLKAGDDTGKKTIVLKAYDAAAAQKVGAKKASANVKIEKGAITAFADEDSFFVGNPIGLHGTTTAGSNLYFYIEGTNFKFTQIDIIPNVWAENGELEVVNGEWTAKFDSTAIKSTEQKKLVAGTYTIVVSTLNATSPDAAAAIKEAGSVKDAVMSAVSGTAAVTLTQPFLTGIEAADVAIQDTDYDITGTAYSAEEVRIYIFGTNFFVAAQADVDEDDETFEYTLKKGVTKDMAPGTYFYLIQHPMNDKNFNVWNGTEWTVDRTTLGNQPAAPADFFYAATAADGHLASVQFIFNAYERGTNYAAQALLDEISGQNIDDIFVQGTFKVEAQKLTINPIPAEVVKGTALTVSGTTNSGEGVEVIVNVLAGTFGATVKGDENAATFLTAKAVTEEDGTFAAAIDTSKLEAGNYIVTVELNGQMYDSAAVEIVEKAPETPVDPVDPVDPKPVDPVTPTEPTTPGFGALAALAGLGAVAVLLLRRE